MKRLAAGWIGAVLVAGAGVAVASAPSGLPAGPETSGAVSASITVTQVTGFSTATGSVRTGGALWSSLQVSPASTRSAAVQYRREGTSGWATSWRGVTSSAGRVLVPLQPPAIGNWQFRVSVAATATATAAVTGTRLVVASGRAATTSLTGYASAPARVSVGGTVSDDVLVLPRSVRAVWVQARRPGTGSFITVSRLRTSSSGAVRLVYQPDAAGSWGYRVAVPATATATGLVSPVRTITAIDTTAPGSVTGVSVTGTTAGSVSVSWTNPTAADFAGVTIRRAEGTSAPDSVTAGVAVAETSATASSFTDTGLAPSTTYSYALFARDAAGNTAPAATVTATTKDAPPTGPTAALWVGQHFGAHTNKVTVGTDASFDASDSFPAANGSTLVSATLDYGDGSTPDALVAGDFWGTTHTYTTTGAKTVTLTVTDSTGSAATTSVTVTVYDAPTASTQVTSGAAHVGTPVTLALNTSVPSGTQVNSYEIYVFGPDSFTVRGQSAPPASQDITFTMPGSYTVSFCVSNDAGGSVVATELIQVS